MLREYELMYIVRPELDDDAVRSTTEGVQSLVVNAGGEVTRTTLWGKRRLAYEVQHLRDGHYVLLQLRLDAHRVTDVERALRIHETVFRHLLVVDESVAGDDDAAKVAADPASENGTARTSAVTASGSDRATGGPAPGQSVAGTDVAGAGVALDAESSEARAAGGSAAEPQPTSPSTTASDDEEG